MKSLGCTAFKNITRLTKLHPLTQQEITDDLIIYLRPELELNTLQSLSVPQYHLHQSNTEVN